MWVAHIKTRKKVRTSIRSKALISKATGSTFAQLLSFGYLSVWRLTHPSLLSSKWTQADTSLTHTYDSHTTCNLAGTLERVRSSWTGRVHECNDSVGQRFKHFLLLVTSWTVETTKSLHLERVLLTPLCYLELQYDIAKVFNVECNLSIKLENHSFIWNLFFDLTWKNSVKPAEAFRYTWHMQSKTTTGVRVHFV